MTEDQKDPNQEFYDKAEKALRDLFQKAQTANELHFVMALMPEMRGMQDGGWNTAEEAVHAYEQFSKLLEKLSHDDVVRIRVVLAFYQHVAECSGFYEIPKKMLLTIEGKGNNFLPFQKIVKRQKWRARSRTAL